MSEENKTPLLEVKDLKKWFPAKSSPFSKEKVFIKAVDGVSFTLNAGETLGVVGESGCGKSTMGRSVLTSAGTYQTDRCCLREKIIQR